MKLKTIYKKTKTGATQEWTIEVDGNKYRTHSGQVGGAITTNEWTVVYGKNIGKANGTTDSDPIFSQPKLDGIRCIVTKDGMFSRNGKAIISAPHIGESLNFLFESNPNLILDGELYADKFANDFNAIVSLVKKTKPTADDLKESAKNIEYHIYDIPSVNETFDGRLEALNELFQYFPKCVIGKQATIKYFNLTPDGIPRFPFVINIDRNSYE